MVIVRERRYPVAPVRIEIGKRVGASVRAGVRDHRFGEITAIERFAAAGRNFLQRFPIARRKISPGPGARPRGKVPAKPGASTGTAWAHFSATTGETANPRRRNGCRRTGRRRGLPNRRESATIWTAPGIVIVSQPVRAASSRQLKGASIRLRARPRSVEWTTRPRPTRSQTSRCPAAARLDDGQRPRRCQRRVHGVAPFAASRCQPASQAAARSPPRCARAGCRRDRYGAQSKPLPGCGNRQIASGTTGSVIVVSLARCVHQVSSWNAAARVWKFGRMINSNKPAATINTPTNGLKDRGSPHETTSHVTQISLHQRSEHKAEQQRGAGSHSTAKMTRGGRKSRSSHVEARVVGE